MDLMPYIVFESMSAAVTSPNVVVVNKILAHTVTAASLGPGKC